MNKRTELMNAIYAIDDIEDFIEYRERMDEYINDFNVTEIFAQIISDEDIDIELEHIRRTYGVGV